jgi:hypothetical protein
VYSVYGEGVEGVGACLLVFYNPFPSHAFRHRGEAFAVPRSLIASCEWEKGQRKGVLAAEQALGRGGTVFAFLHARLLFITHESMIRTKETYSRSLPCIATSISFVAQLISA